MNDEQYLEHCKGLLTEFAGALAKRSEHLPQDDPLRELAAGFAGLGDDGLYASGTALTTRLFETYPDLAPLFPRQLLWFFGGDCLHYMPDEEIAHFQQLEDERLAAAARGEVYSLPRARAKLLKLQ